MKRIYITNAIPYVNAAPHVGHALEYVQTDCLVRFYKLLGYDVFYTADEVKGGICPDGHKNIEEVEEENYFFKLSNYSEFLDKLIETNKLQVVPETRKNEVLSFIRQGLEDFSIARSVGRARGWGVPVPDDDSQVMYVWFDALTTYLTALGFGVDEKLFKKYWTENPNRLHIIGKGIIRFHAVYWPAMLKSAGIPLPKTEFVHGYITVEGQKISKTLGNVIDPFDLVKKFGQEAVRYYLLREIPAWGDGDFSIQRFKELYNGELANGLGNLVARVARLCADTKLNLPIKKNFKFKKSVSLELENFRFDRALIALWAEIAALDKKINEEKPWELQGRTLKKIITPIAQEIREIAFNLSPFLPKTSQKILDQFTGKVTAQDPLFPRILQKSKNSLPGISTELWKK